MLRRYWLDFNDRRQSQENAVAKGKGIKVDQASKGSNPVNTSGGGAGKTFAQKAIPGPTSTGGPPSMRKALARKAGTGSNATGAAGRIR